MNLEAFQNTRDRIATQPEEAFDMSNFDKPVSHPCGTSFCLAGHAILANGGSYDSEVGMFSLDGVTRTASRIAAEVLGLPLNCADRLFSAKLNYRQYGATKADILTTLDTMIQNKSIFSQYDTGLE